jgi:hypothetical protein
MKRVQVWSSGGGVQSAAIAALIVTRVIEPPDLAVIVDTEREASTTWEYMDEVITPALASVGVTLDRVKKSDHCTVDLYSPKGEILIPAFTDFSEKVGKLPTYCSTEWKQRVMRRWASLLSSGPFDVWLGISTDEKHRVKQVEGKWQNRYPLIDGRMNRGDCIALVERLGWPAPPRSSCWMCPNRGPAEWQSLKMHSPTDFQKAVEFENQMRERDDSLWLTKDGLPLTDMDVTDRHDLFSRCDSGYCFT